MERLKVFNYDVSTLPKKINQKLVNEKRTKLFERLKDSFKRVPREMGLKDCLKNRAMTDNIEPINNCWFMPNLGA